MARISLIAPDFLTRQDERLCIEAKGHKIITSQDLNTAFNNLLSDPPELLIIQKGLPHSLDKDVIQALKNSLQLSLLPVLLVVNEDELLAGISHEEYPVDDLISLQASTGEVLTRVELALARMHRVADNNPLTKLPGNSSILRTIQAILDDQLERAVGYVDIDNFKPYNDKYGFSRGDEVIRMTARVLVNCLQEYDKKDGFVGHIGGDDFVIAMPLSKARDVCQSIIDNFSALIPLFLDEEDLEAGCFCSIDRQGKACAFPITSLSIAVVTCEPGRYKHYGEVTAVAAQLKKKVKQMEGSNYFIDRRKK